MFLATAWLLPSIRGGTFFRSQGRMYRLGAEDLDLVKGVQKGRGCRGKEVNWEKGSGAQFRVSGVAGSNAGVVPVSLVCLYLAVCLLGNTPVPPYLPLCLCLWLRKILFLFWFLLSTIVLGGVVSWLLVTWLDAAGWLPGRVLSAGVV